MLSSIVSVLILSALARSTTSTDHLNVVDVPIVNLSYGSFQGITVDNVTSFLGVPFAEAPYVVSIV